MSAAVSTGEEARHSRVTWLLLTLCLAFATGLVWAGSAQAGSTTLDLAGLDNVQIVGEKVADGFGMSVSDAGDVNGDGRDDVIVGAYRADNNSRAASGSAYVIYGQVASGTPSGPTSMASPKAN